MAVRADPPMLEARLEAVFRSRVRQMGGMMIKLAPTVKGIPDRLVMLPGGRLYLVELKTSTGRLSPAQVEWHRRAKLLKVRVIVLSGLDQIESWVEKQERPVK